MEKTAILSEDRKYRYELWRRWGDGEYCCFIGLNPSTADESSDDPTIRRCINFAKDWGFDALCMVLPPARLMRIISTQQRGALSGRHASFLFYKSL